jgi:hypothetical protein
MDVKFEGGNVQLLSDPVTNNGAGSGSPANAATMMGVAQVPAQPARPCPGHEAGGEPVCPPTDEEFRDRRNQVAKRDEHEGKAATHNQNDIIRMEGDLARKNMGQKRSALTTDEQNQVTHSCRHCGAPMPGEIEHLGLTRDGQKTAVEAKSGEDFYPAKDQRETERNTRQMQRYGALAEHSGYKITYKVKHPETESQIRALQQSLGIAKDLISVIPI